MASTTLDTPAIIAAVQIQAPGLMLDQADVDDSTHSVQAVRAIATDEPAFDGHFPGHPILPGVLQVDAMRQAAILAIRSLGGHDHCTFLARMHRTKFRSPVNPGDQLDIQVEIKEVADDAVTVSAKTAVAGQGTCESELTFAPPPSSDQAPAAHPEIPAGAARTLDADGIKAVIPHRDPFLFIDRLLHIPSDHADEPIVSVKHVLPTDTYLSPTGMDYVPPPHLVEIAAQTGCAYLLDLEQNKGKLGYFMSIDNADFRGCVRPGDELTTYVQIQSLRERFGKCTGQMFVGDRLIASAEVKFAFVEG